MTGATRKLTKAQWDTFAELIQVDEDGKVVPTRESLLNADREHPEEPDSEKWRRAQAETILAAFAQAAESTGTSCPVCGSEWCDGNCQDGNLSPEYCSVDGCDKEVANNATVCVFHLEPEDSEGKDSDDEDGDP